MDEINSKTVMPNENHMYNDEIFGWTWSIDEFLDDKLEIEKKIGWNI
jgi:hypothetical protein